MSYNSKDLIQLLKNNNWILDRINGSHHIFVKGSLTISVPHPRKDMKKGTYFSILKAAGLK
ncbi:type II toxin-antitoxin system HicA family toxin [Cetobacterium sp. 2A]|uniref:type II toxin-antitoxin system HicA family toxin n=1 Tax=Cetobacterium sp. 2A TaxID=2754723 RepID=UPI00163C2F8F|nr:type II toxin-antitoxin system HicA family toxin [Cetobacterium sp. 2A]MBC2856964.1 type II toxin-antitoxin system HicA family toxin [Cetobacterium sp. 2A]